MLRGAVYRVDLGETKRGHEQRGRRYGLVISPSSMAWSVALREGSEIRLMVPKWRACAARIAAE